MTFPAAPPGHLIGVDLGEPQGHRVDFSALARAGCSFAILRATDGLHSIDGTFEGNATRCTAKGLPFGAYHVYEPYAPESADEQAEHFLEVVKGYPLALPPVLDFELASRRISVPELLTGAAAWCDRVEAELGAVVVYTGPAFIAQLDALDGVPGAPHPALLELARRRLWLAHYTGSYAKPPRVPRPWSSWWLWQASGNHYSGGRLCSPNFATLPGTATEVDADLFNGSLEELLAPMRSAGEVSADS